MSHEEGRVMRIFGEELPLRPESQEMLSFDILRFIAAAGIVIHHSNAFLYPSELRSAIKLESWGLALLVDLFFVISGYVIAFVYGGKIGSLESFGRFMRKRVARLFPLHLVMLALFFVIYALAVTAKLPVGTMPDLSPACLVKTSLMLHAIVPCDGPVVNAVSWSISAEMLMYLLFPALFWLFGRSRPAACCGLVIAAGTTFWLASPLGTHAWTELYAPFRALPSFLFGMCLYRILAGSKAAAWGRHPLAFLLLALLVATMLYLMMTGAGALVVLIATYAVCVVAAAVDRGGQETPVMRAAAGLGRLTYGIYMIHLLFVTALVNVIGEKLLKLGYWPMTALIVMTFLLVTLFSIASYHWIENPWRRRLSSLGTRACPD